MEEIRENPYIFIGLAVLILFGIILLVVVLGQSKLLKKQGDKLSAQAKQLDETREKLDTLERQSAVGMEMSDRNIQSMQQTLDRNMQSMQQSYINLNRSLDDKLAGSFNAINQYLQILNRDLGEMKSVAGGIDDVKRVLSNVKARGILGEIQLGAIIEEIMAPGQYVENFATVPGSNERVEYAVKLPGGEFPVFLPIDSKFPGDSYAHLLDAYDAADADAVNAAKKHLIQMLKNEAKDISTKYVKSPYTTDFAVMFLPFEGLYAEAVNLGAIEMLQKEFNVIIAGPSTLSALLNSLEMGFKTLAIQDNAKHVREILGKVKSEFEAFQKTLEETQRYITKAGDGLDNLVGAKTRKIRKALSDIESLDSGFAVSDIDYYEEE